MDWLNLETVKTFLYKVTEVLTLFVAVSLLIGIIFGPETAFFGSVVSNFSSILSLISISNFSCQLFLGPKKKKGICLFSFLDLVHLNFLH